MKARDRLKRLFGKSARAAESGAPDSPSSPSSSSLPPEPPALPKDIRRHLMSGTSLETPRSKIRSFWNLISPYWWGGSNRKEKAIAYGLLAGSLACSIWAVDIRVDISKWNQELGDVFQNSVGILWKNSSLAGSSRLLELPEMQAQVQKFKTLFIHDYALLLGKLLTAVTTDFILTQYLVLRWRAWMTDRMTGEWLNNKAYYRTQSLYKDSENPDQRIQEDIVKFTDSTTSLATDALGTTLSLGTFSAILWNLSGSFNLSSLGGPDAVIPGFLFWVTVGYAAAGTALTHWIGKPLTQINYNHQKYEAFFRSSLIRVRENAEQIALNNGEEAERGILRNAFDAVYANAKEGISKRKSLTITNTLYHNIAAYFPYIITAPLFFTGQATYGTLRRIANAFDEVKNSLSWFIENYQVLTELQATTGRLSGFTESIERSNRDLAEKQQALAAAALPGPAAPS